MPETPHHRKLNSQRASALGSRGCFAATQAPLPIDDEWHAHMVEAMGEKRYQQALHPTLIQHRHASRRKGARHA